MEVLTSLEKLLFLPTIKFIWSAVTIINQTDV